MKKLAIFYLGLAITALCGTNAMATSEYLSDVNDSCGYEVITDCTGCHYDTDDGGLTAEQSQYLEEGACSFCPDVTDCASDVVSDDLLGDAQGVTNSYFATLFKEFMKAMKATGMMGPDGNPTNPLIFKTVLPECPKVAPIVGSDFSRSTGYLVRRVTKKTRNARAIPDAWELKQLENFEEMAADGAARTLFEIDKPDGSILPTKEFEASSIVTEGTSGRGYGMGGQGGNSRTYFRYMRSITMPPLTVLPCLKCHGTYAELGLEVGEALQLDYPYDQAMGYASGQIRGAWTIKIPLN